MRRNQQRRRRRRRSSEVRGRSKEAVREGVAWKLHSRGFMEIVVCCTTDTFRSRELYRTVSQWVWQEGAMTNLDRSNLSVVFGTQAKWAEKMEAVEAALVFSCKRIKAGGVRDKGILVLLFN
jgi:hypothetical protein